MTTEKIILGNALLTDKGDWVGGMMYETNDIVHTDIGIYMSLVDANTDEPPSENWRTWLQIESIHTLKEAIDTKVDKVEGKELSTNDYTTVEKEKLANIEENANNYSLPVASSDTLGGIKVGTTLNITDGIIDYTLPIATVNTLGGVKSTTTGTTANRDYNVEIDSEGAMKVNVPWEAASTTSDIDIIEDIPVAGGPLANLLNQAGITTIDKDTNMQELLMSLFTKEIYPTYSYKEATITAKISTPSLGVSTTVMEVNTSVTLPAIANSTTTTTATQRIISGLSYGYSEDSTTKNTATSIGKSVENISLNGNYSMTRTIQGQATTKSGASITFDASTMTVTKGSNTVSLSITGAKASGTVAEIPSVYIYSNLGNISEDHKTMTKEAATIVSNTPSASTSATITGVYPVYATTVDLNTLTKQSLTSSKTYEFELVASDTTYAGFAIQQDEVISSIKIWNDLSSSYEEYSTTNFIQSSTTQESGGIDTPYTLYTRNEGKVGKNKFKVTLK